LITLREFQMLNLLLYLFLKPKSRLELESITTLDGSHFDSSIINFWKYKPLKRLLMWIVIFSLIPKVLGVFFIKTALKQPLFKAR
jgi:hypothetical protein